MSDDSVARAERRECLRAALRATLTTALLPLAGCASKPAGPPPPPPQPLALLGVLPVLLELDEGEPGFGTHPARPAAAAAYAPPPINPTALGMAIGAMLRNRREAERQALATAVSWLRFDPAASFESRLRSALQQRGVKVVQITTEAAAELRAARHAALPEGVDGVLDVRVNDAGYESRAGAYSPRLGVEVVVRAPTGAAMESFSYYADARHVPKDPRWLTTPPTLTLADLQEMRGATPRVLQGLDDLVERMLERLLDDVVRRAAGQSRLA